MKKGTSIIYRSDHIPLLLHMCYCVLCMLLDVSVLCVIVYCVLCVIVYCVLCMLLDVSVLIVKEKGEIKIQQTLKKRFRLYQIYIQYLCTVKAYR